MTLSVKDASGATQTIKTNDDMAGIAGTASANVLSVQGVLGGSAIAVSVANLPATQVVSAAALPLPAGAATDASLGTIGTAPPTLPGAATGVMGLLRWIGSLFTSGAGVASGALRVVLATDQTALPVVRSALAYANKSGTITAGGTAQALAAAKSDRAFYRVQNQSSGDLWINDKGATAAASQPAFKLAVGAMYVSEPGGAPSAAISIFGATTGQAFEAAEG